MRRYNRSTSLRGWGLFGLRSSRVGLAAAMARVSGEASAASESERLRAAGSCWPPTAPAGLRAALRLAGRARRRRNSCWRRRCSCAAAAEPNWPAPWVRMWRVIMSRRQAL